MCVSVNTDRRSLHWMSSGVSFVARTVLALVAAAVALADAPKITSVVNLASGDERLSPGVLARIMGTGTGLAEPSTVPISVRVNGIPGFVVGQNPLGATVQLPVDAQPGPASVEVEHLGERSPPFEIALASHSPALFTTSGDVGSMRRLDGRPVNSANPAMPGERLYLNATGLGPTNPPVATGTPAPGAPEATTLSAPTIDIAGFDAPIDKTILAPGTVGRYRVFFSVPEILSEGQHSLNLEIGGFASNTVILPLVGEGRPTITSIVSSGNFGFEVARAD